jgi:CBS domain containing-hemolysin-like protein
MMSLLGAIPRQGQEVRFTNLIFTAERVQGRRIAQVLIERLPEEPAPVEAQAASE